ncbi:hypothetical protein ACQP2U_42875 (plasmid) [Nocardia sp. CA-084685]|uniref:hypothetical protein n=1 Tax=Nocardia sp. CA-084685 TaxID=3239970 RepID=UPI003D977B5D
MTSIDLPRHNHDWAAEDYRIVVTGCLVGLSDAEVAKGAGRTLAAVQARAHFLIEPDSSDSRAAWWRLRDELVLNPDYDWESVVRAKHAAEQLPYWDEAAEEHLHNAWVRTLPVERGWLRRSRRASGPRMSELEAELGIHEFDIARRLRYRGWAISLAEVIERLGVTPDGALAAKVRVASDRDATTLHVLIVTDDSGAVLHTSVHPTQATAETATNALAAEFATNPLAMWTISARSVGDGAIGPKQLTGTFVGTDTAVPDPEAPTGVIGTERRRNNPLVPPPLPQSLRDMHRRPK